MYEALTKTGMETRTGLGTGKGTDTGLKTGTTLFEQENVCLVAYSPI